MDKVSASMLDSINEESIKNLSSLIQAGEAVTGDPREGNLSSHNLTENGDDYIPYEERPETYIVPAVFAIIFFVGVVGNGTLIFIFGRNKSMRTIPNTYIFSLAIGDFIVIAGTVPFISTIYTFESWPYGVTLCKLSEFLKDVSVGVTVLTLTMLSVDRYIAIVFPVQKYTVSRHSKSLTVVITASIWCISIAMAIPGAYYSYLWKVSINSQKAIYVCYPFPQEMRPWYPKMMVLLKFLILYALPLLLIASFYVLMARHLLANSRVTVGKNESHLKQTRARTKVAKIVLVFIVIFALCFFPNQVFMMWYYYHPSANKEYNNFWHVWKIMGYVLTFCNSCLNPVALCVISGVFRAQFKYYLLCCWRSQPRRQNSFTLRSTHSVVYRSSSTPSRTVITRM